MYCQNCGQRQEENSAYCTSCGAPLAQGYMPSKVDSSSPGFAILGFFFPLVGLILYLVYESDRPRRAKSAGKGALIGFITKIVLSIVCVVLYIAGTATMLGAVTDELDLDIPEIADSLSRGTTEEVLEKYADVSFGKFSVKSDGYLSETSLEVTVKNKSETQRTFYITIEAVDKNGARLETDTVYADRLNPGQEIHLKAFEYVDKDMLEQFKSGTFKVLEAESYNF